MLQDAIATRIGYVEIDNMINEYNNCILIDLGHCGRDGNRLSDIVISSDGTVMIKNQMALMRHEFANNRSDLYNWYISTIGMVKYVLLNDTIDREYRDAMLYNIRYTMELFSDEIVEFEFKPINEEIPAVNVSADEAFNIRSERCIYGYAHLAEITLEGHTFYILANGHIIASEPCTISHNAFQQLLKYGERLGY